MSATVSRVWLNCILLLIGAVPLLCVVQPVCINWRTFKSACILPSPHMEMVAKGNISVCGIAAGLSSSQGQSAPYDQYGRDGSLVRWIGHCIKCAIQCCVLPTQLSVCLDTPGILVQLNRGALLCPLHTPPHCA